MQTLAPAGSGVLWSSLCRAFSAGLIWTRCCNPDPLLRVGRSLSFSGPRPYERVTKPHLHSRLWGRHLVPQGCPPKRLVKGQKVENQVVSVLLHSEVRSLNRFFFFLPPQGGWMGWGM